MPSLSAVLITKNEESVIERCLKSLQGFDEIIVLDTGSTDKTVQIALDSGATVHGPLKLSPFHFADARNAALDLATSEWVLSIDADEILREGHISKIRRALFMFPECDVCELTFIQRAYKGAPPVEDKKGRLFRKDALRWKYRIHEMLYPTNPPARVMPLPSVVLEHFPEVDKAKRHNQNLELLEMCVQETPEHVYGWRELGMELVCLERWEDAVKPLETWISVAPKDENYLLRSQDIMNLAKCLSRVGRLEDAALRFDQANRTAPERREPLWHAGNEFMRVGMPWEAIKWFQKAAAIPKSEMPKGFHLNALEIWGKLPQESVDFCLDLLSKAEAEFKRKKESLEETDGSCSKDTPSLRPTQKP